MQGEAAGWKVPEQDVPGRPFGNTSQLLRDVDEVYGRRF